MYEVCNIRETERALRIVAGGSILLSVLLLALPPITAYIGAYAVLTGIISWDPMYMIYGFVQPRLRHLRDKLAHTAVAN